MSCTNHTGPLGPSHPAPSLERQLTESNLDAAAAGALVAGNELAEVSRVIRCSAPDVDQDVETDRADAIIVARRSGSAACQRGPQ
jgi:hypothetical protein